MFWSKLSRFDLVTKDKLNFYLINKFNFDEQKTKYNYVIYKIKPNNKK